MLQQVEELQHFRKTASDKDALIRRLQQEVEDTQYKLEHARRAWKDERDKVTVRPESQGCVFKARFLRLHCGSYLRSR